jgi:hypothetical protein
MNSAEHMTTRDREAAGFPVRNAKRSSIARGFRDERPALPPAPPESPWHNDTTVPRAEQERRLAEALAAL